MRCRRVESKIRENTWARDSVSSGYPNTEKTGAENTARSGRFLTKHEVFRLPMKHFLAEWLIYLLNRKDREVNLQMKFTLISLHLPLKHYKAFMYRDQIRIWSFLCCRAMKTRSPVYIYSPFSNPWTVNPRSNSIDNDNVGIYVQNSNPSLLRSRYLGRHATLLPH